MIAVKENLKMFLPLCRKPTRSAQNVGGFISELNWQQAEAKPPSEWHLQINHCPL